MLLHACSSLSNLHLAAGPVTRVHGVVPSSNFAGTRLSAARSNGGALVTGKRNKIKNGKKGAASVRCSGENNASVMLKPPEFGLDGEQTISGTVRFQPAGGLNSSSYALHHLLGQRVRMQLVSLDIDPETQEGRRSSESYLEIWVSEQEAVSGEEDVYRSVQFLVPHHFGTPGAVVVDSSHSHEFLLESLTLEMPDATEVHFSCNSWIYESRTYPGPRIFFANQVYLPNQTPPGLARLRIDELVYLRGDGTGERKTGERIYDYDVYNDLGNPDEKEEYARPVLGGSQDLPYPRRCRTGRKPTKADPASEEPLKSSLEEYYVPRDDMFSDNKKRLFWEAGVTILRREVSQALIWVSNAELFGSFDEVHSIYDLEQPSKKFPRPPIVQASKEAWMSDEEFARQRVAGLNPLVIERLKVFPPKSSLDPETYGPPESSITAQHIEGNLEGLTTEEALEQNKLFVIDYHDAYLPYLERINALRSKEYASRTLLFLTKEGALKPVAIELSLPPKSKGEKCVSKVYTPPPSGETDWIWQLAKAHVAVNDAGYHQLISHWLRTHACMEPFIIATRRQLSALHPLYLLLNPHFKDTMNINALARRSLINVDDGVSPVGGIIEKTFAPGRYCMELSSVVYKSWRLDEQALPADLMKRGMAEKDESARHGLRMMIEDYPYAIDGLDLWATIQGWVRDYVGIYYKDDKAVKEDTELQAWWKEIREVGHGDHKDAEWWAKMQKVEELEELLATVIWVTSGHHAAVNFGQYAYSGFVPNNPTMSYRLIPEPELFFLKVFSTKGQSGLVMATVELLSQHMREEEYLGERWDPRWSTDERVVAAFTKFRQALDVAEAGMHARNQEHLEFKHRSGPANVPYTLLVPTSPPGLTLRGIPNSISI